jgi:hypothetical protein
MEVSPLASFSLGIHLADSSLVVSPRIFISAASSQRKLKLLDRRSIPVMTFPLGAYKSTVHKLHYRASACDVVISASIHDWSNSFRDIFHTGKVILCEWLAVKQIQRTAEAGACLSACSHRNSLQLHATLSSNLVVYYQFICRNSHLHASRCKTAKIGLKSAGLAMRQIVRFLVGVRNWKSRRGIRSRYSLQGVARDTREKYHFCVTFPDGHFSCVLEGCVKISVFIGF